MPADPITATKIALRSLARRHCDLGQEIDELDDLMAPLTQQINPALTELNGVGPDVFEEKYVHDGRDQHRTDHSSRAGQGRQSRRTRA